MGGYISLAFAEQFGQLLKGFGLFHSTAYPDTEEKKQTRKKSIAFIQEHGSAEFIASTTPNLFSEWTKKNNPELVKAIIEQYANFDPAALITYTEAMIRRPDRIAVLEKLSVPVLFIIGEEDKAVPMGDMLKQSHIPSIALIHILKDTAHMGMLEQTAISNEALRNFLDRCLDIH
jgi:pimeloyl-ACP methyl ester carboxylesterase